MEVNLVELLQGEFKKEAIDDYVKTILRSHYPLGAIISSRHDKHWSVFFSILSFHFLFNLGQQVLF